MSFLTLDFKSQTLSRGVQVKVMLPDDGIGGLKPVPQPYKTLYFLPGYSATATELITYLPFRKHCELKGIAVVFCDSENLFYQDYPERNTFYSRFVAEELVAKTRQLLPLSHRREDTFIGGISMGGYGALYNGMKYRDTFSKIAAFSPSCDPEVLLTLPGFAPGMFESLFKSHDEYVASDACLATLYGNVLCQCSSGSLSLSKCPDLWMCCGTGDRLVWTQAETFHTVLENVGYSHQFHSGEGDHEFAYWERHMDSAFSFLAGIPEDTRNVLLSPDKL